MNSEKALTIIIPVYNVSQYINQCLDSLTEDKEILGDLEIIVVNDGTPDDSAEKARVYSDRYPDSVILVNKENGGHGSALNVGIEMATGKYLRALDSDDWVKPDGLAGQVKYIREQKPGEEADAIINPYEAIWEMDGKAIRKGTLELKDPSGLLSLEELNRLDYLFMIYTTCVKTEIYRNNRIPKIDEGIFYDDIEYTAYTIPYIHTVKYLPDVVYQYRLGTAGQSMNPANKLKRQWMYEQVLDVVYDYSRVGGEAQKMIERRLAYMVGTDLEIYLMWDDRKKAKAEFRKVYDRYSGLPLDRNSNKKMQLLNRTGLVGFGLVGWLFKMKTKRNWKQSM